MPQLSTPTRNDRLQAVLNRIGANGTLEIYSGSIPANAAASDTGARLAQIAFNALTAMSVPAGASTSLVAPIGDASADAAGYSTYFRGKDGSGVCHYQDVCSQPWAANTVVVTGQQVHNGTHVYRATTGGTTGTTGPSVTSGSVGDGTVTWAYVAELGMTLDNTNFALGQPFNVTGLTLNEPNG